MLAQDLHPDRALPGDHVGVVVGVNEAEATAPFQARGICVSFVVVV